MKKIVDIILDRLNNNKLSDEQIFGFLAYYYSDLEKSKNSNNFIEKYKNEIEKIFAYKEKNKVSYENAKNLSIDIAKNIKKKNLPKIAGETPVIVGTIVGYIFCVPFAIVIIMLIQSIITSYDFDAGTITGIFAMIVLLGGGASLIFSNYCILGSILINQYWWGYQENRTKKIPKPTLTLQNHNTNKNVELNDTTQEIKLISSPKISKKNKDGKDSNE